MEEKNILICEKCYEENEATRTTCKNCGAKLYNNLPTTCKICGKEFAENDLMNGICFDCFEKQQKENSELKNYKLPPIEETHNNVQQDNSIAVCFKMLAAITIIIGVLGGIIIGSSFDNLILGIIALSSFVISGLFLRAIAEIIQLLEDIKNK